MVLTLTFWKWASCASRRVVYPSSRRRSSPTNVVAENMTAWKRSRLTEACPLSWSLMALRKPCHSSIGMLGRTHSRNAWRRALWREGDGSEKTPFDSRYSIVGVFIAGGRGLMKFGRRVGVFNSSHGEGWPELMWVNLFQNSSSGDLGGVISLMVHGCRAIDHDPCQCQFFQSL